MPLFSPNKVKEVQSFILNVVNNNCPELEALIEGPRLDRRVNLTLVVLIIPMEGNRPNCQHAFTTTTKEFSVPGLSVVLDEALGLEEVIVGFRRGAEMTFIHAAARHLDPLGGGFYQLGLKLTEMANLEDFSELRLMSF